MNSSLSHPITLAILNSNYVTLASHIDFYDLNIAHISIFNIKWGIFGSLTR